MRMHTPLQRCIAAQLLTFVLMLTFTSLFFTAAAFAQTTGKIAGTVTDADTGEPLPGVNVVVPGTTTGTASDADGHYFIINIEPGTYDLQASFIGYQTMTQTGVVVTLDHTTEIDFALQPSTAALDEVVVQAEQEVVKLDMSASTISIQAKDIESVPAIKSFDDFLNLQGGIEGMSVRGGGLGEVDFRVNGLTMVDNRANTPMTNMINLSAIQSAEIIKGGFNAEYGNVRSGVISVVTKDGSPERYSGMLDMRMGPPRVKHSGKPLYDPMSYYLRPYFDEDVAWTGTDSWPEEMQEQYPTFIGWNAVAERLNTDEDPNNDMTAQEAQQKFLWETAAEGSADLGQRENLYGNRWDWRIDGAFGGPVPLVSKALGDLTFFVTHKTNREEFGLPTQRPYYTDQNTMAKLTSRITPRLKISAEGTFGKIESVVNHPRNITAINDYDKSAEDIFYSVFVQNWADHYSLYNPGGMNWADIFMDMQGINVDHTLSNRTFYKLRFSRSHVRNDIGRHQGMRDLTPIKQFGDQWVDERPWGLDVRPPYSNQAGFDLAGAHGDPIDKSSTTTYNMKFDLTSQVNNTNMIKTGVEINYDQLHTFHKEIREYTSSESLEEWEAPPIRVGAYLQDKFEWRGMIANIGVRADYFDPNTVWYFQDDPYSSYYTSRYARTFFDDVPSSSTESHLKISPRLGVSHPITSVSKLFFNYGHFYSSPAAEYRFRVAHPGYESNLSHLGNPNLDLPRTVAYELGYEHALFDAYMIRVTGYYKDVTNQEAGIGYTNYDASVDYTTYENNNYADIRGFELRIEKNAGRWFTGWVNYNYMVRTSGYIGRENYYQDQRLQRLEGLQNPYQEKPLAQPYARAYLALHSPDDYGPAYNGFRPLAGWTTAFIYRYKAGRHLTWDPLDTYELQNNVQWKSHHNWDLRVSKDLVMTQSQAGVTLYMDVNNLFNQKHLSNVAWEEGSDYDDYMRSLHLPMYEGEQYQAEGLVAGDDKPGDIKSDDKPYIDMPDRNFLWYLDQRFVEFGAVFSF